MARKSRIQSASARSGSSTWLCAVYVRLSREDGDKVESESIVSQKNILSDFLSRDPDIQVVDTFVDDGYSGTNFDRPAFQRMMGMVKEKKINCIIVKDLSRLGRNYIEVGNYVERIFPLLDIRFIAVNDNIDSFRDPSSITNIGVPFRNVVNDAYCGDISKKIRSVLDMKRKRGDYIGSFACYGYQKDPQNHNRLIIDEEAAAVVRKIFSWRLQGLGMITICKKLNDLGIPNPTAYRKAHSLNYNHYQIDSENTTWCDSTVRRILKNQMYIGNLVQGKGKIKSYKVQKFVNVPEEDWIIVEGTHEPIVSREVFEMVQDLFARDTRVSPYNDNLYLFSGFIRCADCKRAMNRKTIRQPYGEYTYFVCSTYKKASPNRCTKHTIRTEELENAVLAAIQKQVSLMVETEKILENLNQNKIKNKMTDQLKHLIDEKQQEIEKYRKLRQSLYVDWKTGEITQEDYYALKADCDENISSLKSSVEKLTGELSDTEKEIFTDNSFLKSFKKYRNITKLTRTVLLELVDHILVYEGKKIEIKFKYQDEFDRMLQAIQVKESSDKTA